MTDTATPAIEVLQGMRPSPAPPMVQAPEGADGLTEVRNLLHISGLVETWSPSLEQWLEGVIGCPAIGKIGYEHVPVWWRWTPDEPAPSDPVDEAAHWIEAICRHADEANGVLGLDPSVVGHGVELAAALREIVR